MKIVVVKDFPDLADIKLGSKEVWREIGLMVRERILTRTRAGRDVDGTAFKAYDPAYAKAKLKAVGQDSPVNLTVSGAMLNAITITEVTDDSVTIAFSS